MTSTCCLQWHCVAGLLFYNSRGASWQSSNSKQAVLTLGCTKRSTPARNEPTCMMFPTGFCRWQRAVPQGVERVGQMGILATRGGVAIILLWLQLTCQEGQNEDLQWLYIIIYSSHKIVSGKIPSQSLMVVSTCVTPLVTPIQNDERQFKALVWCISFSVINHLQFIWLIKDS